MEAGFINTCWALIPQYFPEILFHLLNLVLTVKKKNPQLIELSCSKGSFVHAYSFSINAWNNNLYSYAYSLRKERF